LKRFGIDPRPPQHDFAADPLASFADRWGLNDEALQRLGELSYEQQEEAMASFSPRDASRDCSPLFLSFLKRFSNSNARLPEIQSRTPAPVGSRPRPSQANPVDVFISDWSLSSDAQWWLAQLPADLQDEVMAEFAPPEGTRDPSTKLIAFVKSKSRVKRQASDPLEDFSQQFGLDSGCLTALRSLPGNLQEEVMQTFTAGPEIRDVNSRFMAYVKRFRSRPAQELQDCRHWCT